MSRQDALERLTRRLQEQRTSLRVKIDDELGLAGSRDDGINDLAETANYVEQAELHTRLATMETQELHQIEHAMERIRAGKYGVCERCGGKIPVARLEALPFSALCVPCQSDLERRGGGDDYEANWASAIAYERRSTTETDVSLRDYDRDSE